MPSFSAADMTAALDALFAQNRIDDAQEYLTQLIKTARHHGDRRAELSILSELLGLYRRTADESAALRAVADSLDLVAELGVGGSVGGATVVINAATTLCRFGGFERALPLYEQARSVYESSLPAQDPRLAALYNNMASAYIGTAQPDEAELLYFAALNALGEGVGALCDRAVTLVNLAELCDLRDPEDERIELCLELAMECLDSEALPRDGYYAFTCEKCAPAFGRLGFFLAQRKLSERAQLIHREAQS